MASDTAGGWAIGGLAIITQAAMVVWLVRYTVKLLKKLFGGDHAE